MNTSLHAVEPADTVGPCVLPEIVSACGYRAQPEIAAFGEWDTTNLGDRAIHGGVQRFFSDCGWRVSPYGFGSLAALNVDAIHGVIPPSTRRLRWVHSAVGIAPNVKHVLRAIRQRYRMLGLLPRLKRAQAILVGGGALLSADAGPHFPHSLSLLAAAASRLGKPLYCLGCSAEGLWTAANERKILDFLAACTVVAPRDVVSAERIAALLRRPVPVFGDFCLTGAATPSWGRRLHVRTGLAINVLRLPGRWGADQGRYEETMAVVVDRLMRSQGGALKTLTVFTTGAQGDAEPAQRVRARLAGRDARLLLPRSLGQLSDMMESSALVVASRLHGAILALNAGALVVGLSPAPKLQNFFSTVGIGDFSFDLDGAARLASVSDIAEHAVALERQRAALSGAPVWACREMIRRQFKAAAATGSASSRGDGQCR